MAIQADGRIVAVGPLRYARRRLFRSPATTRNGSLDPSFTGDGTQTTDFRGRHRRGRRRARGGDPGKRQDRRGRIRGLRYLHQPTPTPDFALARYNPNGSLDTELLGGRKADDRLRWAPTRRGGSDSRRRQDRGGRLPYAAATSRSPATTRTARSIRASPATASRRLTSTAPPGERGDDPGERQDRRGWRRGRRRYRRRLRARPLQPERLARHRASPATASKRPTSGRTTGRPGWRSRPTARSSRSGLASAAAPATSRSPATTRTGLDSSFTGDGRQTTDFGGATGSGGVVASGRAGSSRSAARFCPDGDASEFALVSGLPATASEADLVRSK